MSSYLMFFGGFLMFMSSINRRLKNKKQKVIYYTLLISISLIMIYLIGMEIIYKINYSAGYKSFNN